MTTHVTLTQAETLRLIRQQLTQSAGDDHDRIASEVCEAIGSDNGHGTVYAALTEARDALAAELSAILDRPCDTSANTNTLSEEA